MQDRRARIIAEAQELLSEVGIEEFKIGDLSQRAGVAQRTLYRNFGSREEIIARAITSRHEALLAGVPAFKGRTLADYLERGTVIARFVIEQRSYAKAMVSVFFSPTIDRRIFEELRSIPLKDYGDLFEDAVEAGVFRPISAAERFLLSQRMPHAAFGLVSDWAAGRLEDQQFIDRVPISFLLSTHPYLTDAARLEADRHLAAHSEAIFREDNLPAD